MAIFHRLRKLFKEIQLKSALKVGIAGALGLYVGSGFSLLLGEVGPDKLISGLWCSLAAIIVTSQANLGSSFKTAMVRLVGTALGALLGATFATLFGTDPLTLGLSITLAIMIFSLIHIPIGMPLMCATIAVVMILWKLDPTLGPWIFAFFRFIDAVLGIVIAVIVAYIIWPELSSKRLQSNITSILIGLQQYFVCITTTEKKGQKIKEKIRLLLEQNVILLQDLRMEAIGGKKNKSGELLHQALTQLFTLIISLSHITLKKNQEPLFQDKIQEINLSLLELSQTPSSHKYSLTTKSSLYKDKLEEEATVYAFLLKEISSLIMKIEKQQEDFFRL